MLRHADCESWLSNTDAAGMASSQGRTPSDIADDYTDLSTVRSPEGHLPTIETVLGDAHTQDDDLEKSHTSGFWSRRVCGMSMKVALTVGVLLLLAAAAGAVGAVLGTRKGNATSPGPTPTPSGPTSTPLPSPTITTTPPNPTNSAETTAMVTTTVTMDTAASATSTPSSSSLIDPFLADEWYTLSVTDGSDFYFEATSEISPDTGFASVIAKPDYSVSSPNSCQHWRIFGVPGDWQNATVRFGPEEEWTRLYWLATEAYGPDMRLMLTDSEWLKPGEDNTQFGLNVTPTNLHDIGQYFYFLPAGKRDGKDAYRMYNMKSQMEYPILFAANFGNPLLWGEPMQDGDQRDLWVPEARKKIGQNDGGFTWF